jgi:gas vesicle protein
MKIHGHFPYLAVAVMLLQPSLPGFGAGSPKESPSIEDIGQKVKETARAIGEYSSRKGNEAADSVKSGLSELKSRTSEQWQQVDQAARNTSKEALDQASTQADRLKNGSQDAWGHLKKGFSDAFSSFRRAWDKDGQEGDAGE